MRKIYIVLSYTGTLLSKIVKMYTKKDYSHVSIALDENLDEMYSFGRTNPYLLLPAGFVKEHPNQGTFKRFSKTKSIIYSLEVNDEQYKDIVEIIEKFKEDKKNYGFNIIGLALVMFNKKIKRKKHFYCAEFVKYVLDNSKVETKLPDIIKPDDFRSMDGLNFVYNGLLNEYRI
jgi:hypothetical protein